MKGHQAGTDKFGGRFYAYCHHCDWVGRWHWFRFRARSEARRHAASTQALTAPPVTDTEAGRDA